MLMKQQRVKYQSSETEAPASLGDNAREASAKRKNPDLVGAVGGRNRSAGNRARHGEVERQQAVRYRLEDP